MTLSSPFKSSSRLSLASALLLGGGLLTAASLGGCCGSSCRGPRGYQNPRNSEGEVVSVAPVGDFSLNRGDWLVGNETGVWIVEVPGAAETAAAPQRLGYVVARSHRQVRGGPAFTVYEVSTLDRRNVIGLVDSLGNAKRFLPRRDGKMEVESAGNSTLENSVGAIFDTRRPITLVATSEKKLAFEVLDTNHDGFLDKTEFPRIGQAYGNPDTNKDGKIDLGEFEVASDY